MNFNPAAEKPAILFDLDGTLWDAREQVAPAWNRVLARYPELNRRVDAAELRSFMGKTNEEIAALLLPERSEEEARKIMEECCQEELVCLAETGGTLYPEVPEVLNRLASRYRLYIVSNCQDGYVQVFLRYYGLEPYFDDIEMSGRTGRPKGENIRLLIQRQQISRAIYVGDTAGDQQAAQEAGLPFIYARYGFGQVEEPSSSIDRFGQIEAEARKWLG